MVWNRFGYRNGLLLSTNLKQKIKTESGHTKADTNKKNFRFEVYSQIIIMTIINGLQMIRETIFTKCYKSLSISSYILYS